MRGNNFGDSDFGDDDETEESVEEEINIKKDSEEKTGILKMTKNIFRLNTNVNKMAMDNTGSFLYIAGVNTPIVKFHIKSGESVKEMLMPIHCSGIAVDSNDHIWVHNLNNQKLTKLDSNLEVLKEWDGNDGVNLGKIIPFFQNLFSTFGSRSNLS